MESRIAIEGIHCYAYHGCMEEEGIIGRPFAVDVYLDADVSRSFDTDALEDTLDYEKVNDLVRAEMAVRSRLIEHVAARIVKALHDAFPACHRISVRVVKFNPPVKGQTDSSSIALTGEFGG